MNSLIEKSADVVIVGAGIMGCVAALRAAEAGAKVVVIEKEIGPAGEASGRAQGALRAMGKHGPAVSLAEQSLKIWRTIVDDADADIVFDGSLSVARSEAELRQMQDMRELHASYGLEPVQIFGAEESRKRFPMLADDVVGTAFRPGDGHCNPRKSTHYFFRKALAAGASFHFGVKALAVHERAAEVAGLMTNAGFIETRKLIVAAGMWGPILARSVGMRVPIMPVVLSGCETTPIPPLFSQSIRSYGYSGHQRPNGRVVISAGVNARVRHEVNLLSFDEPRIWLPRLRYHWRNIMIRPDFYRLIHQMESGGRWSSDQIQEENNPKHCDRPLMRGALRYAREIIPGLKAATISRYWAGYIDLSPDGLPIIDHKSGPAGLVLAAGMSGHGLVMGPILGATLSELALEGKASVDVGPYRLARFVEEKVPIPATTI